MKGSIGHLALVASLLLFGSEARAAERGRHISFHTTFLRNPVEGYHQLTVVGDLAGSSGTGHMELDPNWCQLNDFGDRGICTEMAVTERTVTFHRTRTADPSGLNRQLWIINGSPFPGVLFLIVPDDPHGTYRLLYRARNGERTAIAIEPLVYGQHTAVKTIESEKGEYAHNCRDLAHKVDGTTADAQVRPGFLNNTFFLILHGKKPNLNTWVEISPVRYPKQPEYWRIDVKECYSGNILLPTISGYAFHEEISQAMGTKGIELHWANGETQIIDKP